MGTLYLDTETASPFEEPPNYDAFRETEYFEPVVFAAGYLPSGGDPTSDLETDAFFRAGPWGPEHDVGLFDDLFGFVDACPGIDRAVTFNGDRFDCIHLRNWAERGERGDGDDLVAGLTRILADHVDLMPRAVENCREPLGLPEWRDLVSLDDACDVAGVENPSIEHADYELDPSLLEEAKQRDTEPNDHITNKQMPVLGEAYVEAVANDEADTSEFRALERAMYDYAVSDITPLAELHRKWGP